MITIKQLDQETQRPLQQWDFPLQTTIIRMGRFSDNDVVILDYPEVSRYHVELLQEQNQWRLISKGTNGTFLNGYLIPQGSQSLIASPALLQLAHHGPLFQFESIPNSVSPPPPEIQAKLESTSTICNHQNNQPHSLFCIHCGQPMVEKEEFIRQYQILRILGRGGMGTTYIAWDKDGTIQGHPMLLVLKEMNADMEKIAKANELFEREARILKELNHPGVPAYYDFFIENHKKYLAMELIHGKNLEQFIYEKGAVTPDVAIGWMLKTCDILAHLHSFNPPLVHRDLKPANLMLRHIDQQILLLDFGAVKEIGTPLGTCISSEGYGAPEQMRGQPCIQSDLYAIAPTLIFILTSGNSPLKYYTFREHQAKFDLSKIPSISGKLRSVIEKASEQNVGDRYQTAQELAQALKNCL
jgi:serine/threonine protein kinase, bacterial